ncbi:DUF1062 domain-containing protein [Denitrobaculum tricleocarpae]|uniref:DUF1062 domain-containing protein n=1 Tax=Denitrobaculum tricleocarpae TaxID=2591009 RepID=A0A545T5G6_9PROT|nr:DUF1062 domain-containing protein [Denitrobaculum tricleocarpae]TQV72459.1 DUF1062 domain-containing protein [Denitrobaculum tricleocarpae]
MTRLFYGHWLSVRWTVSPLTAPRPLLFCSGCGQTAAFETSGKFRLNANGKRLDAWLLYRCSLCETTWKRPVVERQAVQALDPGVLGALQSNDAALAKSFAFDLAGLRRFSGEIEICGDVTVQKAVISGPNCTTSRIEIEFSLPHPTAVRADRVLARELGLSRTRIAGLARQGKVRAALKGAYQLRKPVTDGLQVHIDLSDLQDAARVLSLASGQRPRDL